MYVTRKKYMKEESIKKEWTQSYDQYGNKKSWIKFSKASYSQVPKW